MSVVIVLILVTIALFPKRATIQVVNDNGEILTAAVPYFTTEQSPRFLINSNGIVREREQKKEIKKFTAQRGSIEASVLDAKGKTTSLQPEIESRGSEPNQFQIFIPGGSAFVPGKLTLKVILSDSSKHQGIQKEFIWGVVALNFNQSSYSRGEAVEIGMAILNDEGLTLCNAKVEVTITTPTNETLTFSTADKGVSLSDTCEDHNVTNAPDYKVVYIPNNEGRHRVKLKAETTSGLRERESSFLVTERAGVVVTYQDTATRIYPIAEYTVKMKVRANIPIDGEIRYDVPSDFEIKNISGDGKIATDESAQKTIMWGARMKDGDTLALSYTYRAPSISPEFYLLGPLEIWKLGAVDESANSPDIIFRDTYQWEIASDLILASGDGIMIYGQSTTTPQWRTYNFGNNTFGAETNTVSGTSGATFRIRTSPTKQEAIAGYVDTSGTLQIMCFNGSAWTNEWTSTVGGTGTTRRFDISYETNTGDVVVAYSRNDVATNAVDYQTKAGSLDCGSANWSGAASMPTTSTLTTENVHWVKAAWDKRAAQNLITVIWADANADLGASVWDGSAFGNLLQLETSLEVVAAAQDVDDFDVEYESSSGDVMVAWANSVGADGTNGVRYATCTGGTSACTWTSPLTPATFADDATSLDISANPNTDEIVFGSLGDAGGDLQVGYWSGSAWTNTADHDTSSGVTVAGTHLVATGWLVNGATTRSVVVYQDGGTTNIGYSVGNGTTFTIQTDATPNAAFGTPQKWYDIQMDPFTKSQLMFSLADTNNDLFAKRLLMNATPVFFWTDPDGGGLEDTLQQAIAGDFSFAHWRFISSIIISGKIYSDEGTTLYNCATKNLTVAIKVNGAGTASGTCTTSGGTYSVTLSALAEDNIVTAYIDGATPEDAVTVTKASVPGPDLTNFDLYLNRVILRHEDAGPITNTNLDSYDNGNDADIQFTVSSGFLTVLANNKLIVTSGTIFTPGNTVSTPAFRLSGTYNPIVSTLFLTAGGTSSTCTDAPGTVQPFCISGGTFNQGGGTVNYSGTTATTVAGTTYHNLGVGVTTDTTATTYTLGGNTTVMSVLTVGSAASTGIDTLAGGSAILTLAGGGTPFVITVNGTFSAGSSTVLYTGNGSNVTQATYNQLKIGSATAMARKAGLTLNTLEPLLISSIIDQPNGFAYFGTESVPGVIVKVRLSDFTRVGTITLNTGEDNLSSAVIDQPNGFAYFGTTTTPGIVIKINLATFTRTGAITLNSGENSLISAVIDQPNGFAYFGTGTTAGIVVKIQLSDFTRVGAITLSAGENALRSAVIDQPNGFAYFGTATSPAIIVKINLTTFTRTGGLTLNTGEGTANAAVIDQPNGFAYFGTLTSPAIVVKVNLTTFTRTGAITLNSGENQVRSAVIDQPNGFAYFGMSTTPGIIVKINLSTFTRTGAITVNSGENSLRAAVIDLVAGQAYFGTYTSPALVVKIDISSFTRTGAITLNSNEGDLRSAVIDQPNGFAYFGTNTSPGIVVKINLATFTRTGALTLNTGENSLFSAVIDQPNGFAYFATNTSPSIIVKINLGSFTRTGAITLLTGENLIEAGVIDQPNGFAYFATGTSPSIIVKINLTTFTRTAGLTLSSGENLVQSAVIDQPNGFAYFGTNTSPGIVVKIRLSDLTRVGSISLNTGENTLSAAVIDQPNGFAYFGASTVPGIVVKINLGSFTRISAVTLNTGENSLRKAVIDQPNGFAYFGTAPTPGIVVKMGLNDLTSHTLGTAAAQTITTNADATMIGNVTGATNNPTFDVNGNFVIDPGGTYIASSTASFTVGGNWTNNGTFTSGTGTVTLDSTTTGKTLTGILNGTSSFYNLTANGSGGAWSSNAAMTVANNFTVTAGNFTIATAPTVITNDVSVGTGATLTINASTDVNGGDMTTTGTGIIATTAGIPTVTISGTGNIGGGSGAITFYNLTTSGSGTTTIASAITALNDLSVGTGTTMNGTNNVTVNGNVNGGGTVTMTGGTFEQRVTAAADKTFGSSTGSNNWTFNNLTFSNAGVADRTLSMNAGTGSMIINGLLQIGSGTDSNMTILDNETSNDRIFDVNGNVSISSKGQLKASSTQAFFVAGNWTLNSGGIFTSGTGTVTFDTAGTSTILGATTFHNFTSTTPNKTLQFEHHVGNVPVITFNGTFTITGTSGNQIHIHSDLPGTQWKAHFAVAQPSSVTEAHIHDAGCDTGTADVTPDVNSIDAGNNGPCWFGGSIPDFTQSAYRFGNNENGTTVNYTGSPAQDTPLTVTTSGQKFRLRLLLHVGTTNLLINGQDFKLQFGEKPVSGCTTASYADVATGSGVIRYFDNSSPADGDNLTSNGGDPTHGADPIINQDYEEANNFTNSVSAINASEDGKWDFSLENNSSVGGKRYCFKTVKSDGTDIDTYSVFPEVSIDEELTFSLDAISKDFGTISGGGSPTDQTSILGIKTNASTGYQVTLWANQLLTKGIATIPNWTGTNAAPTTFGSGPGFAYSTSDSNLAGGTADRFTNPSAKFAGYVLVGPGDPVADNTVPAFTTENYSITYRLAVSGAQEAGTYTNNLLYIVTAKY